jgi:polysaccharide pyruvyl transferase WcaK-like protein
VYARDRASRDLAAGLIGTRRHSPIDREDQPSVEFYPPVEVCPDVAFTLAPRDAAEAQIAPPLPEAAPDKQAGGDRSAGGRLIGLNISGLLWAGGYTGRNMFGLACDYRALILALLERLLADTQTRVLLVPHVTSSGVENDPAACRAAREALPEALRPRVHLLADPAEPGEVKAVISRCDCLIGSRMHACIAALSQGIPAIGLAYSRKFAGVFESVDAADMVVDARSLDQEQILAACMERLESLAGVRSRLRERVPLAQARIRSVFEREFGQLARRHAAGVSRETPAQTAIAGM